MKPKFLILFLFLLVQHLALSQNIAPGGVKGAICWYGPSADGQSWQNQISGGAALPQFDITHSQKLNFNPGFCPSSAESSAIIALGNHDLHQASIFTVYQAADSALEKSIWHLQSQDSTHQILTTRRLADLEKLEYLNFPENKLGAPTLNTYLLHSPAKNQQANTNLILGSIPSDRQLPVVSFTGVIPEIIVFDRVLSPEERLRVESYLAIKYGLSLQQPDYITYLNASGDTIWNGRHYPEFSSHITGIGRDDASGLRQNKSTCSYEPGLLTISTENLEQDQTFLIWGDNRESLQLTDREVLKPALLQRQWQIQVSNAATPILTTVQLDSNPLHDLPEADETFWLVVFSDNGDDQYYAAEQVAPNGLVTFKEVAFTAQSHRMTFAIGPKMMVTSKIIAPECESGFEGSIALKILGGRAPFDCQLSATDQIQTRHWHVNDHYWQQPLSLPSGNYALSVQDADGHQYREEFYFQAKDAPLSNLQSSYSLPENGTLTLDASNHLDQSEHQFLWLLPSGERSNDPKLQITQPGSYRLTIDRDGCQSQQEIIVHAAPDSPFKRVELFPNPSPNGHFQLRVLLKERSHVQLDIYRANGQYLNSQRGDANDYYLFSGQLPNAGTYLLTLTCEGKTSTQKLIVE